MSLNERLPLIVDAFSTLSEWVGPVSETSLRELVTSELGSTENLDHFVEQNNILTRALPLSPILHIASGNSPHGIFQSLLRGLTVGAHNFVKLPSSGLPAVNEWHNSLPPELKNLIELAPEIQANWLDQAEAIVAYGSDQSLQEIRSITRPDQRFIAHGHKISIGIVQETSDEAAKLATTDICRYQQQGCLSLIHLYCPASQIHSFGEQLAKAMADYETQDPRGPVDISTAGAIANLRENVRFHASSLDQWELWESPGSSAWTIIATPDQKIEASPLFRCVFLKPLPETLDSDNLGPDIKHLSTVALYPFSAQAAQEICDQTPASRVCPLGQSQQPTLFWNADGIPPLRSLIRHQDLA